MISRMPEGNSIWRDLLLHLRKFLTRHQPRTVPTRLHRQHRVAPPSPHRQGPPYKKGRAPTKSQSSKTSDRNGPLPKGRRGRRVRNDTATSLAAICWSSPRGRHNVESNLGDRTAWRGDGQQRPDEAIPENEGRLDSDIAREEVPRPEETKGKPPANALRRRRDWSSRAINLSRANEADPSRPR